MKPLADSLVNRLMDNSINLVSFQNRINELDIVRRQSNVLKSNRQYNDEIIREIKRFESIIRGIEGDNKIIRKKLEDLTKKSTKKVVNSETPYRRFEGGKKRKTRKKRRKSRRKRRKSRR